jgi:hypothetical protein
MKTTTSVNLQTIIGTRFATTMLFMLLSVCGAAASAPKPVSKPEPKAVANTAVQLRIGGVPSDSVICFQMKLDSIMATNVNGAKASLLQAPVAVEIMHWAADSEVVAVSSLPQGQYSQIAITAQAAKVTSLNPVSGLLVTKTVATNYSTTIKFSPALIVGTSSVVLNLQVNPANILSATVLGGSTVNKAQLFHVGARQVNTLGSQQPQTGQVERIVGSVTSVSSNSVTVLNGQTGLSLTFATDSNTNFRNTSRSTLAGLIVSVRGRSNSNGSLVAKEIEALENQHGSVVNGIASGYIPNTQIVTLALQDGAGTGMKNTFVGAGVSIDPNQNPSFAIDTHDIDMTGMDSLTFDSSSLVLGQNLQVQSIRGTQNGANGNAVSLSSQTVTLEPQALIGKVSNYQAGETSGTASFDLVFATNAAFNVVNPFFYTMHVYQQRGTTLQGLSAELVNGQAVQVWGLVFFSQAPQGDMMSSVKASGRRGVQLLGRRENQPAFIMVAGRISAN